MRQRPSGKILALHAGIIVVLLVAQLFLPPYHHTNLARIMVFASFAVGYNVLMGYTGLLSLGHAMFFAAGVYGAGLTVFHLHFGAIEAFGAGVLSGLALATAIGLVALRTTGVSFLIVTLMFAQAAFLTTLHFNQITGGDQGLVISSELASLRIGSFEFSFADPAVKYNAALLLFAVSFAVSMALVYSPVGRVLIAIRENEARTRMLGYNTYKYKLLSMIISGAISGAAGAMYALLFSYVGSTFASIQYSIFPLLWTLVGGVGTLMGPILGTGLMFYVVDVSSGLTHSHLIVVGIVLVVLVLWFPRGIVGTVRERWFPWLP
ncbi:MAG: branched-chain amino acid ABC transporter permease [Proteobacteria bacterium]|nr:branched-chain amino acid ABC transporter permease [Pseudomonadota bacterium]